LAAMPHLPTPARPADVGQDGGTRVHDTMSMSDPSQNNGPNGFQKFLQNGGSDFLGSVLGDLGYGLAAGKDLQEGLSLATQRMTQMAPQRGEQRQSKEARTRYAGVLRQMG